MSLCPIKRWIVRNSNRSFFTKHAVVFHNYNSWGNTLNNFPDPIIVTINIDMQQSNIARKISFPDKVIDILKRAGYTQVKKSGG